MVITANQIRAARALLDWNQSDLAKECGLARPTIVNIESEVQKPSKKTLEKIHTAFDDNNIEFTNSEGVRRKSESITIYSGTEKGWKFLYETLDYAKKNLGSLYISNIYADEYERCFPGFFKSHYYHELMNISKHMDIKRLRYSWDSRFKKMKYGSWKIIPDQKISSPVTFYVFGNYVGIVLFLEKPIIIKINSAKAANLYREKFLIQWNDAIDPDEENSL